jgi:hypothetical protein
MTATAKVLNVDNVNEIFEDCLFQDGEDTTGYISAEGIFSTFGFHPDRLESHRQDIEEMLAQLPDSFQEASGGGMTFLNACLDKAGNQWGDHIHMEQLFCLGIGIGKVKYLMPRDMWDVLPGGMPYCVVLK